MTNWVEVVSKYNFPDHPKSWWQVANSLLPYLALWGAMYHSLKASYWLTLLLSVLAAGFLVRIFIIFHDCGHGSFFRTENLNRLVGIPLGLLVFTPYHRWHRDHFIHHSTVGNLDKRGIGDVETLTVKEYQKLTKWGKLKYRVYRHPIFLFGFAPIILFLVLYRMPKTYMNFKQRLYLHLSNIAIVISIIAMMLWIGWREYILIQLPIIYIASIAGVWLFYVQHQFDKVVWKRSQDWNYQTVALQGSSFLKLPLVLQWFSGNIGYHHIHHLSPRIPNYKLQRCHEENEIFSSIKPLSFKEVLNSFRLRLWDEEQERLITFDELKD